MMATILVLLILILISVCLGFYQIVKQQGRILLRLDHLEGTTNAGAAENLRAEAEPHGLPLGTDFPTFAFPDLSGGPVALADFRGKRVLLVHWNFECGFCDSLAPDLARLEAAFEKQNVQLTLLASGDAPSNQKGAAEHDLKCPILLMKDGEAPKPFRHQGTPVAYLLDQEGRVAAPFASGADRVLLLAQQTAGAGDSGTQRGKSSVYSQPLNESPGPHRVNVLGFATERETGLGDVLKRLTSAFGIKPCVGCERRAAWLNRWMVFSRAAGDGLKAGRRAPVFRLPDVRGRMVSLEEYRGRRVLLVFSDPQCGPCDELAPHLVRLHQEHANNGLAVVMVGRGNAEENRRKAEQHGFQFPLMLQEKWRLSRQYGSVATPAAFLIGEDGVITDDVALGRDAVLTLARDGLGAKGGQNERSA
ncbi:MAG TPA: TlpA disulfide reductase family protein [Terriglobia bacterium]|nr:TlpA disulfide reductase family protein [Terriglobia bacterium]